MRTWNLLLTAALLASMSAAAQQALRPLGCVKEEAALLPD